MLSRSGLSFRKLIAPRRPRSLDEIAADEDACDEFASLKATMKEPRSKSWVATRRSTGTRKRPPTPIIASQRESFHNFSTPLPPLPDETPQSSATSLCSCENHVDTESVRLNGVTVSPLCSTQTKPVPEARPSKSSPTRSYDLVRKYMVKDDTVIRNIPRTETIGTTLNLLEALQMQPDEFPQTSSKPRYVPDAEDWSDNVQQLMQETDEAFKAVDSALAEAKLATQEAGGPRQRQYSTLPQTYESPSSPPTLPAKSIFRKPGQKPTSRSVTSPVLPPTRSLSVRKPVRQRSKKKSKATVMPFRRTGPAFGGAKPTSGWIDPAPKSISRRTLTENVAELINGKLLHRVEADELLTPGQIEAYKMKRLSLLATKSCETLLTIDTESTDTPIEPFHLEDLPTRIGSAGMKLPGNTPVDEKSVKADFDQVVRQDFALPRNPSALPTSDTLPESEESLETPGAEAEHVPVAPLVPLKSPLRYLRKNTLPTIPEIAITSTNTNDELFLTTNESAHVASSDYIFLQSSPYTCTAAGFRHGPIRFLKSELNRGDLKVSSAADEGLDWTAFQMAILGGAGDWLSDSTHGIHEQETAELDALAEWWASFHFENPGQLVTEDVDEALSTLSPTSTISGEDCSDVSYADIEQDNPYYSHHQWSRDSARQSKIRHGRSPGRCVQACDIPIPVQQEHPNGFWNEGPYDASGYDANAGVKRWMGEGHPKKYNNRDSMESFDSLPQSPMLDLRVIRAENGVDMDVVPMGYNLGHDLGDFLRWEAEHTFAVEF